MEEKLKEIDSLSKEADTILKMMALYLTALGSVFMFIFQRDYHLHDIVSGVIPLFTVAVWANIILFVVGNFLIWFDGAIHRLNEINKKMKRINQ